MKKLGFIATLLIVLVALTLCVVGCTEDGYTLKLDDSLSLSIEIDSEVDFTKYFSIADKDGNKVEVTKDMIDLSKVDLTKEGTFTVTLTYEGKTITATFTVVDSTPATPTITEISAVYNGSVKVGETVNKADFVVTATYSDGTQGAITDFTVGNVDTATVGEKTVVITAGDKTCNVTITVAAATTPDDPDDPTDPVIVDLSDVLGAFADTAYWNFKVDYERSAEGEVYSTMSYAYKGDDVALAYEYDGVFYTEYLVYDENYDFYEYYVDNGDGTYSYLTESDEWFELYAMNVDYLNLYDIATFEFAQGNGFYYATDANACGNLVLGEYEGYVYTEVRVYFNEYDELVKIQAYGDSLENGETVKYIDVITFYDYGTVDFTLPEVDGKEEPIDPDAEVVDLSDVFTQYEDYEDWNFKADFTISAGGESQTTLYGFAGYDTVLTYDYNGATFTDYLVVEGETYNYYSDNGDGTYSVINSEDEEFNDYSNTIDYFEISTLNKFSFIAKDDHYTALFPQRTAAAIFGAYDGDVWEYCDIFVTDGKISKITAKSLFSYVDEETQEEVSLVCEYNVVLSGYGEVVIDVSDLEIDNTQPEDPTDPDTGNSITTVFTSQNLDIEEGGLEFTSNKSATNFDKEFGRGPQFAQENGEVILTSVDTLSGVTSVSVLVATNQDAGFDVSVTVGDIAFTVDGVSPFHVGKTGTTIQTVVFTSDTPCEGQIVITLTPSAAKKSMWIHSIIVAGGSEEGGEEEDVVAPVDPTPADPDAVIADISDLIANYDSYDKWNFKADFTYTVDGKTYTSNYEFLGDDVKLTYVGEDSITYVEYLVYYAELDSYAYYYDNGDGTYTVYDDTTEDFYYLWAYVDYLDLTTLAKVAFTAKDGFYSAVDSVIAGNAVLGEYEGCTWSEFDMYVNKDNTIAKIIATLLENYDGTINEYEYVITFSDHGKVADFALNDLPLVDPEQPTDPEEPTEPEVPTDPEVPTEPEVPTDPEVPTEPEVPENVMEKQVYDADKMDTQNLQDKLLTTDGAIGLPSTGTYSALVVPVQFTDTTITSADLAKLELAFNGSASDTGWQSVKSYYQQSSFGKLNLSFDIQSVYVANGSASYYNNYYVEEGETAVDGPELLLRQVLAYYENKLDLTKYDVNKDGCIDAVYLIYSAPVDYEDDDSIYWAYVTWSSDETEYDGLLPYYYLFAGFDFMDEDVSGGAINASTYIHETGHLLGLDDYYDYYEGEGSDMGLGGADMMDNTIGDQNVYSKTMLGWITPNVVTESGSYALAPSQDGGNCIMLLLDYDGSYFCEYLLIDLYTNDGLNAHHSKDLYDGAEYGVRIYHVSSSANDPYADQKYGSFTDNNNSTTALPLITLVEADGETKFASGKGWAESDDLWQSGDVFSSIVGEYTRNDGKVVNFDITFTEVTADGATITITFLN